MNRNTWDLLQKDYEQYPEDFSGPSDIKEILEKEKKLKVFFSKDYIKLIENFGSCILPGYLIHGIRSLPEMSHPTNDVVKKTLFYRSQNWPGIEDWYIVSDDGRGNPIGVDPEGRVWLSDHDSGFEKVLLAENFEEFLYKLLTDTLYE